MTDFLTAIRGHHLKPVNEVEARRAVAGLDADIMEEGLPSEEAEAITKALRLYLMGNEADARAVLSGTFVNGTVDDIMAQFADDTVADEAA